MSIFKTCDIRGLYGPELDDDTAYRLGRAVASRWSGQEIVVGGDLRLSTPALKAALIEGLLASGARVVDLGILPTPAFYFAKHRLQAPAGIMVTASHNPAGYNGFKLMLGELPITPEELQSLARQMAARDFVRAQGTCRQALLLDDYMASLRGAFGGLKRRRVVVDAGNGSMGTVAPPVLRALGQRVDELYCAPDGSFPNRDPNPAVAKHLGDLGRLMLQVCADVGAAYDGDGDRVIFVDEQGRALPADRTLVLFVRQLLRQQPGAQVVYDIKCSSVVAEEVRRLGGTPLIEKSGHAFIKRRLLIEGAALGGEISGHYFFGALGGDDALYATLYLLRVLDAAGMSLGQAIDTVPIYPITPDLRLPCPPERAQQALDELLVAFRDQPITTLDGVRIEFPAGWALARISVTEPLITLRFEAHTFDDLEAIKRRVRAGSPTLDQVMSEANA